MLELILFAVVLLPFGWLVYDGWTGNWIGSLLGIVSLFLVGFVVHIWSSFSVSVDKNLYFGDANKTLIAAVVDSLEAGETEKVLKALKRFDRNYSPNYEDYPRYADEVHELVVTLQAQD